jgi:hypothetical protein
MEVFTELRVEGQAFYHLLGKILGVRGEEPDPGNARKTVHQFPEKKGKIDDSFRSFVPIGIDVLPQEGYFFHPPFLQVSQLLKNLPGIAGHFSPSHIGNDAVGTKIVTSVHDGNKGFELPLPIMFHGKMVFGLWLQGKIFHGLPMGGFQQGKKSPFLKSAHH